MDEAGQSEAASRKRRRRSVRLRRRSDIIPMFNLNEEPLQSGYAEAPTSTSPVYGSTWLESQSPIKRKRQAAIADINNKEVDEVSYKHTETKTTDVPVLDEYLTVLPVTQSKPGDNQGLLDRSAMNETSQPVQQENSVINNDLDYEPLEKKQKNVWNVAVKQESSSSLEAVFSVPKYSPCSIGQRLELLEEQLQKRRTSSSTSHKNRDLETVLDSSTDSLNVSQTDPFYTGCLVSESLLGTPNTAEKSTRQLEQTPVSHNPDVNSSGDDQTTLPNDTSLLKFESPKETDDCLTPRSAINISNSPASQGSMSPEYPGLSDIDPIDTVSPESVQHVDGLNVCDAKNSSAEILNKEVIASTDNSIEMTKSCGVVNVKHVEVTGKHNENIVSDIEADATLPKDVPVAFTKLIDTQTASKWVEENTVGNESENGDVEKKLDISDNCSDKENNLLVEPLQGSVDISLAESVAQKPETDRRFPNETSTDKQKESTKLKQNKLFKQTHEISVKQNAAKASILKDNSLTKGKQNMPSTEKLQVKVVEKPKISAKSKKTGISTIKRKDLLTESESKKKSLPKNQKGNDKLRQKSFETLAMNKNKTLTEHQLKLAPALKQCDLLMANQNIKKKPGRKPNVNRASAKGKMADTQEAVSGLVTMIAKDVIPPQTIIVGAVTETSIQSEPKRLYTERVDLNVVNSIHDAAADRRVDLDVATSGYNAALEGRVDQDVATSIHDVVLERINDLKLSSNEGHNNYIIEKKSPQAFHNEGCLRKMGDNPKLSSAGCLKIDETSPQLVHNEVPLVNDEVRPQGSHNVGHFVSEGHSPKLSKEGCSKSEESDSLTSTNECYSDDRIYVNLGSEEHLSSKSTIQEFSQRDRQVDYEGNVHLKVDDIYDDVQVSLTCTKSCDNVTVEKDSVLEKHVAFENDLSKNNSNLVLELVTDVERNIGKSNDSEIGVSQSKTKRRRSARLTYISAFVKTIEIDNTDASSEITNIEVNERVIPQCEKPGPSKPKRRRSAKFDIIKDECKGGVTEVQSRLLSIEPKRGRGKSNTVRSPQSENLVKSEMITQSESSENLEKSEGLKQLTSDISQFSISEKTLEADENVKEKDGTTIAVSQAEKSCEMDTKITDEKLVAQDDAEQSTTSRRKRRRSADAAVLKIQMAQDDYKSSPKKSQSPESGTSTVIAKNRKRKLVETPELIEQIYRNKNYVKPEEHKPWVTINENPNPTGDSMGKRKLQRFIDFEKPTQLKLRRRLQKARKNGWDPTKRRKVDLKDDFVQGKLADLWSELEAEEREKDMNSLQNKLKAIVDTQ